MFCCVCPYRLKNKMGYVNKRHRSPRKKRKGSSKSLHALQVKNKRNASFHYRIEEQSSPVNSKINAKNTIPLKYIFYGVLITAFTLIIVSIPHPIVDEVEFNEHESAYQIENAAKLAEAKYAGHISSGWGEYLDGVINGFDTDKKEIALTLDACGGKYGSGADLKLINFLIEYEIKATLFINFRWIERNKELFLNLVNNELFEIENHGYRHLALSATPYEVYGIKSTGSPAEAVYEIAIGAAAIEKFTGKRLLFFRSGTAYYDDTALKILNDMGYSAMAFSVNADEGARLSADKVYKRMMQAKGGDIIIAHMNRPKGYTAEGMIKAIPELQKKGFKFITLSEVTNFQSKPPKEEDNVTVVTVSNNN